MAPSRKEIVLREAAAWAKQNSLLLDLCFAEFEETSQWPLIETLEHRLERAGQTTSAAALAREMPAPLGFGDHERIVLLCRGISSVEAARGLLEDWFSCVHAAYERWVEDPASEFGSEQVLGLLDGEEERCRRVSELLLRESWMFGSGSGDAAGPWSREIVAGVRVARDARDAGELLDARAEVEWSDPEPPSPVDIGLGALSLAASGFRCGAHRRKPLPVRGAASSGA